MAAKKVLLQEERKKSHGHSINSYHSGMFTSSNDSKKFCRKTGNIQLDDDDDDEDEEEDNTSKKTENVVMKFNDIPAAQRVIQMTMQSPFKNKKITKMNRLIKKKLTRLVLFNP